jgi:hypothetical protein
MGEKDTFAGSFFEKPRRDIQHRGYVLIAYLVEDEFEALKDGFY